MRTVDNGDRGTAEYVPAHSREKRLERAFDYDVTFEDPQGPPWGSGSIFFRFSVSQRGY